MLGNIIVMKDNKAIKMAQLYDGDKADTESCVADLVENSKLDNETALRVASAIKAKYLPQVADNLGLTEDEVRSVLSENLNQTNITTGIKNDNEAFASNGSDNVKFDGIGENNDENVAKRVASNAPSVRTAINEALSDQKFAQFVNMEHEFDVDDIEDNDDLNVNGRIAQTNSQRNLIDKNKQGEKNMNRTSKQVQRDRLIKEAEQLLNSSKKPFEYATDGQLNTAKDLRWPISKLENDGGNSLKNQTESFTDSLEPVLVPTLNQSNKLQFSDDADTWKFTENSTGDGSLEYKISPELLDFDVPTEMATEINDFEVPTQLTDLPRKATQMMSFASDFGAEEGEFSGMEDESESFSNDEEEAPDAGDKFNFSDDEGSEGPSEFDHEMGSSVSPQEALENVENMDEESLFEFLAGLKDWANENGINLAGSEEGPEMESSPEMRESIASVLGPGFDLEKAEEVLYDCLVTAGIDAEDIGKMTYAEGVNLYHEIRTAQKTDMTGEVNLKFSDNDDEDENAYFNEDQEEVDVDNDWPQKKTEKDATMEKAAEIFKARTKVAYDIWSRMAMSGQVGLDEVPTHVDNWLSENMSVNAMINVGKVMLSNANQANKRTASHNTSNLGLITSPAFSGEKAPVSDLKTALAGYFTQPDIRDIQK